MTDEEAIAQLSALLWRNIDDIDLKGCQAIRVATDALKAQVALRKEREAINDVLLANLECKHEEALPVEDVVICDKCGANEERNEVNEGVPLCYTEHTVCLQNIIRDLLVKRARFVAHLNETKRRIDSALEGI